MACQAEGRDGTRLGGCETYIPWPHGRYGGVFVAVSSIPRGRWACAGIRHQPRGSNAPAVYQLAHRRLRD